MKQPVLKVFERASTAGYKHSRLEDDTTAPTAPTINNIVANSDSSVTVTWTWGTDGQSALRNAYVEIRTYVGPGAWTQVTVPFTGFQTNSYTFTGLTGATGYEIRVANDDNAQAHNLSAYSALQLIITPPSPVQLAPGHISIVSSAQSVIEGRSFATGVARTGAGSLSEAVLADYVFENFPQGTPSPSSGTLRWAAGVNDVQQIVATAGSVTATRTGNVRIFNIRPEAGSLVPSTGTTSLAISVLDGGGSSGQTYIQTFDQVGLALPSDWSSATNAAAGNYTRIITTLGSRTVQQVSLTKNTTSDRRVQFNHGPSNHRMVQGQTACFGVDVQVASPYRYPLHTFVWQNHHDENVRGTCDDIAQVPFRLEIEPEGWSMTTIFVQDRTGPMSGLPNTKTRVFTRRSCQGCERLSDAFHNHTPGAWTRWAFRINWDERYTGFSPGNYPGYVEVYKNGVLVEVINYPIGLAPHCVNGATEGGDPVFAGQLTTYNNSGGLYNSGQPVPADPLDRSITVYYDEFRLTLSNDIDYVR